MRALLLLLVLLPAAAAQLPATWTATLEAAGPAATLRATVGQAVDAVVVARYTVTGAACNGPAPAAPPGSAALVLGATPSSGVNVTVEEPSRTADLACGPREESFDVRLTPLADGSFRLLFSVDATPTCTGPCGLSGARAEATATLVATLATPPRPVANATVPDVVAPGPTQSDTSVSKAAPAAQPASPLRFAVPVIAALVAVAVVVLILERSAP